MKTYKILLELMKYKPLLYIGNGILWVSINLTLLLPGLLTREFFMVLEGDGSWGMGVPGMLALVLGVALSRIVLIYGGAILDITHRFIMGSLLRYNMLKEIYRKPGGDALKCSDNEMLTYFRDDVEQIEDSVSWCLDVLGSTVFTVVALYILFQINSKITIFVFTPLICIVIVANKASKHVQKYRKASREATQKVTGTIGELFNSVQSIKVAGAEDNCIKHLEELNNDRRKLMLKDNLFNQLLNGIFNNTVTLGTGFMLLIIAQMLSAESFSLGDFSLFIYCLGFVSDNTTFWGEFMAHFQQTDVSLNRMKKVLDNEKGDKLVVSRKLYVSQKITPYETTEKEVSETLETLHFKGISYKYQDSGRGISGIDLEVKKGEFVVITGRIGSGKSTLLKLMTGLLKADRGEIHWNDKFVNDPKSFFIPPHSAYTPQVPGLFSDSVENNILLGHRKDQNRVAGAVKAAVLNYDLDEMEKGLNTMIGTKGVKLSGGQMQRTAAARMFVRDAEIYLIDDMSSALDVKTENKIWQRFLDDEKRTCVAVSHRKATLKMADKIVVLKEGKVDSVGTLDQLLSSSQEMQELWI